MIVASGGSGKRAELERAARGRAELAHQNSPHPSPSYGVFVHRRTPVVVRALAALRCSSLAKYTPPAPSWRTTHRGPLGTVPP